MNEQDKLIEEQAKQLPPELVQAINSIPWKNLVGEIAKENGLSPDQSASLEQETMLVIYAFEPLANYVQNLIRELEIPQDRANVLANSVADKILNLISSKAAPAVNSNIPEIAPEIHPMVESQATTQVDAAPSGPVMILKKEDKPTLSSSALAATAPKPVEQKPTQPNVALPDYRYDGGKDPYREPIK